MEQGKIFITVPQFAQAAGISQQAVYQQIKKGKLKQYAKKTGRQTEVDAAALTEIYGIEEEKVELNNKSTFNNKRKPESTSETTELQLALSALREQLITKDRQIDAKDRQIDDLSQRLREAHKLLNDSNEALRMLTGPQVKKPEVYEEPVQGSEHADQSAEAEEECGAADRERQRLEAEKNAADQERQRLAEELAAERQRHETELQAAKEKAAKDAAEAAEAARQAERSKSWFRRLFNMD